jgi:ankyrin repeat protein/spore coat protein CotH
MFRVRHDVRLAALFMCGIAAVSCGCGKAPVAAPPPEPASPPAPTTSPPAEPTASATVAPPTAQLTLDTLFPEDRVLDVKIEVLQKDWDTIRHQSRNFVEALQAKRREGPIDHPYTYVTAKVTIDGVTFENVGLRKKGFIGSQNAQRPSLKIKLNHEGVERAVAGLTTLTFNNDQQDTGHICQFMGYALFRKAGTPAPRCAHASITVNGKLLGVYSHVETVREALIARAFGNADGTLYEGTVVDFHAGWAASFENKFGADDPGREKIEALIQVLTGEGEVTEAAIGEHVDLDAFYRFWAIEGLLGFWDGYSANNNNFFVYLHPQTGKFHFLPWGADCMFEKVSKLDPDPSAPVSVKTKGLVAHKLYQLPAGRERYAKTLTMLLEEYWDENELLAQIDQIDARLQPHLTRGQKRSIRSLERTRGFIHQRRNDLVDEMADGMPLWAKRPDTPFVIGGESPGAGKDESMWGAARRGEIDAVRKYLTEGGDVNAGNDEGDTLLTAAALVGEDEMVGYLLKQGADAKLMNKERNTALHGAALLGQFRVVQILITSGADINARNQEGFTPLDSSFVPWNPELQGLVQFLGGILQIGFDLEEIKAGRVQVTTLLRERNAKHGSGLAIEMAKRTARWVTRGDIEALSKYLADGGDANARDDKQMTLLNLAALTGQTEIAKLLIGQGADVNATNGDQTTPLHSAAFTGRLELAKLLLAKDAGLDTTNDKGETPLDSAAASWTAELEGIMGFVNAILQIELDLDAIESGRPQVAKLLRERGARSGKELAAGRAPLSAAVKSGDLASLRQQLNKGANPNSQDDKGLTLLSLAALAGQRKTAALLIERGADVDKKNRDGGSPLHTAAFLGRVPLVELLLTQGAKDTIPDGDGQTPLDLASDPWTRELAGVLPFLQGLFQLEFDAERIQADRPRVANLLRKHRDKGNPDPK